MHCATAGEPRVSTLSVVSGHAGVTVNNPHVYIVEDGKQGGKLDPAVLDLKARFDPQGLLNPGKLRGWPVQTHEAA